ncbi:NUDIX hydrolase [Peribacillus sp. SCS-26]|uniref:NUDIX hydrolase n=1 Tax=Paraperibacillus marinus TaxID=3115295 RepID=UPI003905B3F2
MQFERKIGMMVQEDRAIKINQRVAVRAVILREEQILMVKSDKGDHKFPGGGVEDGESFEVAIRREVAEETGYVISGITEKLGIVVENHPDVHEENAVFQMISHYYSCQLSEESVLPLNLDDYEAALGYHPIWLPIQEAIRENSAFLESFPDSSWAIRENLVLEELLEPALEITGK